MALGKTRITIASETDFAHEREAIEFAIGQLPNHDPYHAWGLVDLLEPSTGRLYEIDLIALGHNALYLIEIKSGPGTYTGDSVDWWRAPEGEPPRYMASPYALANHKAKVLASRLASRMQRVPWVQPLVFLSHPDIKLALQPEGRVGVVTRSTFARAITHHEFPSANASRLTQVNQVQARDLAQALHDLGLRPRKGKLFVGEYELGGVIEDGPGYQDRVAVHRTNPKMRNRRARIYLVPQQTTPERRSLLRRAADREAAILDELREHRGVLQFTSYVADAPLGPTVLFDAFDRGLRLDAFLRARPNLSFSQRLEIVAEVGRALGHCHRKAILHGGLSPEAVLVRGGENNEPIEVRLFNFQLASAIDRIDGTAHISALTGQGSLLFQAPEVREDPSRRDVEADVYSLGVLAYYVLTGQLPAPDLALLDERLTREQELDPRATGDAIPAGVAEAVACATRLRPIERYNDASEWVEQLLSEATAPAKPTVASFIDPLGAGAGDRVAQDLEVVAPVGQGATARVLRVRQEGNDRDLALKVSLGGDHDERIRAEGRTLKQIRHANIVECLEVRDVGGRPSLLLGYAHRTLLKQLGDDGAIALDFALRWGEELLQALEELEGRDLTHRDLKPANIGLGGASKKADRLLLLDFSLSHADPKALDVGTAAYRDPFLRTRGEWDTAADRWSAALILHEMLTGVRPTFAGGTSSLDPEAKLLIAAERFPAGLRDRLVAFFERTFQRSITQRHVSAAEMRRAWNAVATTETVTTEPDVPSEPRVVTDAEITRVPRDAAIASLPLSERAKNALDRAGVLRVHDLLPLADNRLSAIRGVGRLVAKEVLDFRDRWRLLHAADAAVAAVPFFAGYRGEDLMLDATSLDETVARTLMDGGLRSLAALAGTSETNVRALAERHAFPIASLREVLDAEHRRAEERAHPVTLEGWMDALLPKKRAFETARVLFGLDAPKSKAGEPASRPLPIGAGASRAAKALGQTTAAIYISLSKDRKKWGAHPVIGELVALARAILEDRGGAAPLRDAAEHLLNRLPYDRTRDPARVLVEAAALLRIVAELRRLDDDGEEQPLVPLVRLADAAWLALDAGLVGALKSLGAAADDLADRAPLASSGEAQRLLVEAAAETPFARLPAEALLQLAARASARAACSTRLELYPRGMPAPRALELTAGLLTNGVSVEQVQKRVRDRYPDAEPLPGVPELHPLMHAMGLEWVSATSVYQRPGAEPTTTQHTSFASHTHLPALAPAEDAAGGDFEERLRHATEQRLLRVLPVHAHKARQAERRLSRFLGVPARPLDVLLIERIERFAEEKSVRIDAIHAADRNGPGVQPGWSHLLKLAQRAADDLLATLLPAKEPLLLTQPGLIARYRLREFLDGLVASSQRDDCASIFLLLPSHDHDAAPVINGDLAIPGLLRSSRLWVPSSWIGGDASPAGSAANATL